MKTKTHFWNALATGQSKKYAQQQTSQNVSKSGVYIYHSNFYNI